MDLRPRSHIHHYFPHTILSYRKLQTYVNAYKHYLWLKLCSYASTKKQTSENFFIILPSHTQNVKRQIRIVSQISINIVTPELRDARINITPLQRKLMPQFTSKRDFIV